MTIFHELVAEKKLTPPKWVPGATSYLTLMGSTAYGTARPTSDVDIYGFCIPAVEHIFPSLAGNIDGFGKSERFEQFAQKTTHNEKVHEFTIYGIVRYFDLLIGNNPNVIDSLFTPQECVIKTSVVAQIIRKRRSLFIHKGLLPKFIGYARSNLKQLHPKNSTNEGVTKFGYDVKAAAQIVRVIHEAESLLTTGDMDLRAHTPTLVDIRNGEWTEGAVTSFFEMKVTELEQLAVDSSAIPNLPQEDAVKAMLWECLEETYGSLRGLRGISR